MGYENLLNEYNDQVLVFEKPQINNGYYSDGIIVIKDSLPGDEKNCTLAEELGHYHTTQGNILDQSKIINIKKELVARRWAYRKLLPLEVFIKSFENRRLNKFDMIEDYEVTEEFLEASIHYYRQKYGAGINIGNYSIMFEPYLQIVKWF